MNSNENKFGLPSKEDIYEKYINKYYIVHPIGTNEHFVGKIKYINAKRAEMILNPYYGLYYNLKSGKNLYNLIYRDFDIFWDLTKITFEPATLDSIIHNCYLSNKERIEKRKSESKNKRKRTKTKKRERKIRNLNPSKTKSR